MTANIVFAHIKSISSKYFSGQPPISVDSIAEDLEINKWDLIPHLVMLRKLDLITFTGEVVVLTETGKRTALIAE